MQRKRLKGQEEDVPRRQDRKEPEARVAVTSLYSFLINLR
jgi:hypothetical protein